MADTAGIGNTMLSTKNILCTIIDGILSMPEGISQVLFVTNGSFIEQEIITVNWIIDLIFKRVILEIGILEYVTIVKTKFSNFRNKSECEKDKERMIEENGAVAEIIKSCNDVIHVDNPPIDITDDDSDSEDKRTIHSNARRKSRQILLNYLEKVCQRGYLRLENINDSSNLQKWMKSDSELADLLNYLKIDVQE